VADGNHEPGKVFGSLRDVGSTLRVRNVMHPILTLCAIVLIPSVASLAYNPNPHWLVIALCVATASTALVSYIGLLLTDPNRLQSEEFLIQSRTLDIVEQKGSRKSMDIAATKLIHRQLNIGDKGSTGDTK
jgi:hypothetical protein